MILCHVSCLHPKIGCKFMPSTHTQQEDPTAGNWCQALLPVALVLSSSSSSSGTGRATSSLASRFWWLWKCCKYQTLAPFHSSRSSRITNRPAKGLSVVLLENNLLGSKSGAYLHGLWLWLESICLMVVWHRCQTHPPTTLGSEEEQLSGFQSVRRTYGLVYYRDGCALVAPTFHLV